MNEKFFTVNQVAEILGVSPATIRKWLCYDNISHHKLGKRYIRFTQSDIDELIKAEGRRANNHE